MTHKFLSPLVEEHREQPRWRPRVARPPDRLRHAALDLKRRQEARHRDHRPRRPQTPEQRPSILDTIASVVSVLRQYEGAGGSALPAASEVAEGVLEESTAGTESVMVVSPLSPAGEGTGVSLPQPAKVVAVAPAASVADVAEGVVGEEGPPSPRPVAAATEEILWSDQLAVASVDGVFWYTKHVHYTLVWI
jgi:hypothetical protein